MALGVLWRVLGSIGISTVGTSLSRQERVREKSKWKTFGRLMEKTVVLFMPVGLRGQANPNHAVCMPTALPLLAGWFGYRSRADTREGLWRFPLSA